MPRSNGRNARVRLWQCTGGYRQINKLTNRQDLLASWYGYYSSFRFIGNPRLESLTLLFCILRRL